MKITKVLGREIFDSRGIPTIECDLVFENDMYVSASVPCGKSKSSFEAVDLRDGGTRLMGMGVSKAIENLETIIAPLIVGKEPDLVGTDLKMIELDGTENKSVLGANAMLAASIALCRAQAIMNEMELYEFIAYLCDFESVALPMPMFNIINGGMHADNQLAIQEFMIVPIGAPNFRASMEKAAEVYAALKQLLIEHGKSIAVGDEGGFAGDFADETEALDLIMEAIEMASSSNDLQVAIALDCAATQFYDAKAKKYVWKGQSIDSAHLIDLYKQFVHSFPIFSIEDGMADTDIDGWQQLMSHFGNSLQIVGDDLFATNPERIVEGIEQNLANAAIIKPNQIGTITETLQALKLCKNNEMNCIVSHRSGETDDTFIVDLAVGTSAGQIKSGAPARGERTAKYNQLLRTEDELAMLLME